MASLRNIYLRWLSSLETLHRMTASFNSPENKMLYVVINSSWKPFLQYMTIFSWLQVFKLIDKIKGDDIFQSLTASSEHIIAVIDALRIMTDIFAVYEEHTFLN